MSKGRAFRKNQIENLEERRDQVKHFIPKKSSRGKYTEEKTLAIEESPKLTKGA